MIHTHKKSIELEGSKVTWLWSVAGDTESPAPYHPIGKHTLLHGQGLGVIRRTSRPGHADVEVGGDLSLNPYCPKNPNQTGGLWPYMGITYPDVNPVDLYMLGGYGGYFQNPGGSWVTEEDHPVMQAGSHIHEHSNDRGWIRYSHQQPWRDRLAFFEANQDDQHLCQWSVLAQTAAQQPFDLGLGMLIEACAHSFLRLIPGKPRGTFHHLSGQERAQGRILLTAVDMFKALNQLGYTELAKSVGRRGYERFNIDKAAFIKRNAEKGLGFNTWAGTKHYSTGEIGILFWGMLKMQQQPILIGTDGYLDARFWMREAARWCFESFRFYDITGDRKWSYPYYEDIDHKDLSGPVSSEHFAWLAAMHHEPRNPTEIDKRKALEELGQGIDERFKA